MLLSFGFWPRNYWNWLIFKKKSFQFCREIWMKVLVILFSKNVNKWVLSNKFFLLFFSGIAHGGVWGENSPDPASPNAASQWRNVPGSVKENPSIASSCRTSQRGCRQSLHFRYVKTRQNLSKPIKGCQNLSKPVKACQTCQNLSKLVKTCQNMPKLVRTG